MHCWMPSHRSAGRATNWSKTKMLVLRELANCLKGTLTPLMAWSFLGQQLRQGVRGCYDFLVLLYQTKAVK